MIAIPNFEVKEASRIYGDTVEKVAFNINVDPVDVFASLAGGYAATRVQGSIASKQQDKAMAAMQKSQRIENDTYAQVSDVLSHLKIVFTPINVIYSVNGQVFEIIGAAEMTPTTKLAFINKDGAYFRNVLVNKMNSEIQLAQQVFASRLITSQEFGKTAGFIENQHTLLHMDEETFGTLRTAFEHTLHDEDDIVLEVGFDSLRPFEQTAAFFDIGFLAKVGGLFDYFQHNDQESVTLNDLENQVKVGFMPDRVLFLHRGQLIEQLPLLGMNEAGYDAYRKRDKDFFMDFFTTKTAQIAAQIALDVAMDDINQHVTEHVAAENVNEEVDTVGDEDSAEDAPETRPLYVPDPTLYHSTPMEREHVDFFRDPDIHPMLYAHILTERFGNHWEHLELGAIYKQLEVDYDLTLGFGDIVWNKIAALHALMGEHSSFFDTVFAFEKFVRTMAGREVDFTLFQSNIDLEDILFALNIIKAFRGPESFGWFHTEIPQYIAEELFDQQVRFIASPVYDTHNVSEKYFFEVVNDFLMRKWKLRDAHGILEDESRAVVYRTNENICHIVEMVLSQFTEEIDAQHLFASIEHVLIQHHFLDHIANVDMVKQLTTTAIKQNVLSDVYLSYKDTELDALIKRFEREVIADVRQ
jgi:hypothetical protein